jgi:hypothetical protein
MKENEVGGAFGTCGRGKNVCWVLMGKREGKRPLGRPRHSWEDGIKIDLREIGLGGGGCMEWIHLYQDRGWWWAVVNMVMNLRVLAPWS